MPPLAADQPSVGEILGQLPTVLASILVLIFTLFQKILMLVDDHMDCRLSANRRTHNTHKQPSHLAVEAPAVVLSPMAAYFDHVASLLNEPSISAVETYEPLSSIEDPPQVRRIM